MPSGGRPRPEQGLAQSNHGAAGDDGSFEVSAHANRKDRERFSKPLLSSGPQSSQLLEGRSRVAIDRTHPHQAAHLEQRGRLDYQLNGLGRVDAALLRLAAHIDLDQHLLGGIRASERFGQMERGDGLNQLKAAGRLANLVRLKVPDEVPLRALDDLYFGQRLVNSVLAEDAQPGVQRLAADVGTEALCDRDDGDVVGITAGAGDALAHLGKPLCDAHRTATIAPNRLPSGCRRWDGKRELSFVHIPMSY